MRSSRAGRAAGIPAVDYARFAEAICALALASIAIRVLPFRAVVRLMGRRQLPGEGGRAAAGVRVAVKRASRRLPWRIVCFQEGLAAHWMLRRRGAPSLLHYGLQQSRDGLGAHVWVTVDGTVVVGEEESARHACVAVFPALPPA